VDSTEASELIVGSNGEVTVKVPHIQGSGSTVFKGSKRPCNKECILIIDKETGEVTLEKLASNIQLKKIRSSNQVTAKSASSQVQPVAKMPSKPTVHKQRVASKDDNANIKIEGDTNTKIDKPIENAKESQPPTIKQTAKLVASKPSQKNGSLSPMSPDSGSDTSSSSSSDSDSDSDQDDMQETREQAKALDEALMEEAGEFSGNINLIDDDLKLTDSDSD